MELDVLGLIGACSYALDCVEEELVGVTNNHAKRVAYMSVVIAKKLGMNRMELQNLAICSLLHDNALVQYIKEECNNDITSAKNITSARKLGVHCTMGEKNISSLSFYKDVKGVILYHHENASGSGPFGKKTEEVPLFARIIHMCDLLDAFCRASSFTHDIWIRAVGFLDKYKNTIIDEEVINYFFDAFDEEAFLSLGDKNLEDRLWSIIVRKKLDLTFTRIKAVSDFFASIVDYKSPFTSAHSIGVANRAYLLSKHMGFSDEVAQKMYLAGALHDIGKVAVGNEILEKPDKLTNDEFKVMKDHASFTYYILSKIDDFEDIRDWASFHHERLDGSGYPFNKTANDLNQQERIMACVDIYQALTEDRPYKKGMPHEKAMVILYDMALKNWIDEKIVKELDKCFS